MIKSYFLAIYIIFVIIVVILLKGVIVLPFWVEIIAKGTCMTHIVIVVVIHHVVFRAIVSSFRAVISMIEVVVRKRSLDVPECTATAFKLLARLGLRVDYLRVSLV